MLGDDMTYCIRQNCKNTSCYRHYSHIDWSTSKHSNYGASLSDFAECCKDYDPDGVIKNDCKTDGSRV